MSNVNFYTNVAGVWHAARNQVRGAGNVRRGSGRI